MRVWAVFFLCAMSLFYAVSVSAAPQTPQNLRVTAIKNIQAGLDDTSDIVGTDDRIQMVINEYRCAIRIIQMLDDETITDLAGLPEISNEYSVWRTTKPKLRKIGYEECVHKNNLFPVTNSEVKRIGVRSGIGNSAWLAAVYVSRANILVEPNP